MGTTAVLGVTGENTRLTVQRALGIDGFAERVISVQDGGRLNIEQPSLYVDHNASQSATILVQGADSRLDMQTGTIFLGVWGRGDMVIADGGNVNFGATSYMATAADASSDVTVTGHGSRWDMESNLEVGRAGNAALKVLDGGVVTIRYHLYAATEVAGTAEIVIAGEGSALRVDTFNFAAVGDGQITLRDGGSLVATQGVRIGGWDAAAENKATFNIGAAVGEAAAVAGRLDGSRISLGVNGVLNFNHTGLFTTSAIVGSHYGSLGTINHVAGQTILAGGAGGFSGVTNLSGGVLEVDFLSGTLNISGGELRGTNMVQNLNILSGGSYLAKADRTLQALGNVLFEQGSYFDVEVMPEGYSAGAIYATGQITIEGGTVRHVGNDGKYKPRRIYVILNSELPIIGQFDGVETNYAFLDASLQYHANNVNLVLQRNDIDFSDIGITRNQRAVGNAISALDWDDLLFNLVVEMSEDDARSAFTALSGEAHGTTRTAMLDDTVAIRRAIAPAAREQERAKGSTSVWFSPISAKTAFDASSEFAAMDVQSQGGLMGADYALSENLQLGFSGGVDKAELEAAGFKTDRDSYHLGLYAKASRGKLGLRGGYTGSWHEVDGTRVIDMVPDFRSTQRFDYEGQTRQAFVEANWAMSAGQFDVTPFVSAAHVTVETDAFEERGASGALTIDEAKQAVVLASVGVAAQRDFTLAGRKAFVSGRVAYENASGDVVSVQNQAFDFGDRFTVEGMGYDENAVSTEIGATLSLGRAGAVSLDWQGVFGDQRTRNQISATYRLTF